MRSLFRRHTAGVAFPVLVALGCGAPDVRPIAAEQMIGARLEIGNEQPVVLTLASAQVKETPLKVEGVDVTAVVVGAEPLEISGASSRMDLESGDVEFEGDVRLVQGAVVLRCSQLKAKYTGEAFKAATATGNVRVEKDGVVARGDRAEWDATNGSVTLTGAPILEDERRRLRGAEIVIYLDERRLECKQCSLLIEAPGRE